MSFLNSKKRECFAKMNKRTLVKFWLDVKISRTAEIHFLIKIAVFNIFSPLQVCKWKTISCYQTEIYHFKSVTWIQKLKTFSSIIWEINIHVHDLVYEQGIFFFQTLNSNPLKFISKGYVAKKISKPKHLNKWKGGRSCKCNIH